MSTTHTPPDAQAKTPPTVTIQLPYARPSPCHFASRQFGQLEVATLLEIPPLFHSTEIVINYDGYNTHELVNSPLAKRRVHAQRHEGSGLEVLRERSPTYAPGGSYRIIIAPERLEKQCPTGVLTQEFSGERFARLAAEEQIPLEVALTLFLILLSSGGYPPKCGSLEYGFYELGWRYAISLDASRMQITRYALSAPYKPGETHIVHPCMRLGGFTPFPR